MFFLRSHVERPPHPQNTAEYARWLAGEISRRYRPTWFEPDTAMFLAVALEGYANWLDHQQASALNFTVTAIDDLGVSRVIAAVDNVDAAWAAYSAAVPKQTRGRLMLHQKARYYRSVSQLTALTLLTQWEIPIPLTNSG